jgi:hypothetical protein
MDSSPHPPDATSGTVGEPSDTETVDATGRFRVYLDAAPRVGKTYAMLSEGRGANSGARTSPSASWSVTGGRVPRS